MPSLQQAVLGHLGDESASAVVLDCRNGEVLAMATNAVVRSRRCSIPACRRRNGSEWSADNRGAPLINKATHGLYAPGSTFKMAVAVAALEAQTLSPTDRIDCPGYLDLGDTRFHCWRKGGHGLARPARRPEEQLRRVLLRDGAPHRHRPHRRDGATGSAWAPIWTIDLPTQRTGLIPTREWRIAQGHAWNLGDTIVSGIGQGYIQVTPMQLATYVARVATGRAIQPHLTRKLAGEAQPGAGPSDWPMHATSPTASLTRCATACGRW